MRTSRLVFFRFLQRRKLTEAKAYRGKSLQKQKLTESQKGLSKNTFRRDQRRRCEQATDQRDGNDEHRKREIDPF